MVTLSYICWCDELRLQSVANGTVTVLTLHALPLYVLLIDPGYTRLGEYLHSTQMTVGSGPALA